jgi:hypothetical protein
MNVVVKQMRFVQKVISNYEVMLLLKQEVWNGRRRGLVELTTRKP